MNSYELKYNSRLVDLSVADGTGQRVSIGSSAARSTALTVDAVYEISTDVTCWIVAGANTVDAIAGADYKLYPDTRILFKVLAGKNYISVIRDSVDSTNGLAICRVA